MIKMNIAIISRHIYSVLRIYLIPLKIVKKNTHKKDLLMLQIKNFRSTSEMQIHHKQRN